MVFLEIAQTLACEVNTLGYPKAALFAFCLALQAYNAVALLKAALRAAHGRKQVTEEVSGYYLALEIEPTYAGMMIAIPAKHWKVFRRLSVVKLATVLREIAGQASLPRYRKHPRGPKKPPPRRSAHKLRCPAYQGYRCAQPLAGLPRPFRPKTPPLSDP